MRNVGAFAALAPVAMVAVLFVATGSMAAPPDIAAALAGITAGAMAVGWLVGPLATGSFRADLTALAAYALMAAPGPVEIVGLGGGCGSAELTTRGMGVGGVLAIGAVGIAAASSFRGRKAEPA